MTEIAAWLGVNEARLAAWLRAERLGMTDENRVWQLELENRRLREEVAALTRALGRPG